MSHGDYSGQAAKLSELSPAEGWVVSGFIAESCPDLSRMPIQEQSDQGLDAVFQELCAVRRFPGCSQDL